MNCWPLFYEEDFEAQDKSSGVIISRVDYLTLDGEVVAKEDFPPIHLGPGDKFEITTTLTLDS